MFIFLNEKATESLESNSNLGIVHDTKFMITNYQFLISFILQVLATFSVGKHLLTVADTHTEKSVYLST